MARARRVVRRSCQPSYTSWHTDRVTSEQLLQRIAIDPRSATANLVSRERGVLVTVLLDALAAGLSAAETVRHYPSITEEDVRAAAYGAWLAKQEIRALSCGS
jgi:uncharacterized protein (DUF433 family)